LKKTLEHNLNFTITGKVDLCILAYNDDSIEPYLTEHFGDYLDTERLKVKTVTDSKPYSFGYVKNLSHAMGSGRVLFNLDADNFIDGVQDVLLTLTDDEICISDRPAKDGRGGRIGVTRNTFNQLNGYLDNQKFPDDGDFVIRAIQLGKRLKRAECVIAPLSNEP
jgi:hypothetical protein